MTFSHELALGDTIELGRSVICGHPTVIAHISAHTDPPSASSIGPRLESICACSCPSRRSVCIVERCMCVRRRSPAPLLVRQSRSPIQEAYTAHRKRVDTGGPMTKSPEFHSDAPSVPGSRSAHIILIVIAIVDVRGVFYDDPLELPYM